MCRLKPSNAGTLTAFRQLWKPGRQALICSRQVAACPIAGNPSEQLPPRRFRPSGLKPGKRQAWMPLTREGYVQAKASNPLPKTLLWQAAMPGKRWLWLQDSPNKRELVGRCRCNAGTESSLPWKPGVQSLANGRLKPSNKRGLVQAKELEGSLKPTAGWRPEGYVQLPRGLQHFRGFRGLKPGKRQARMP